MRDESLGVGLPDGWVPATKYILVNDEGDYVGIFNLRHRLTDFLRNGPGHIGYGVAAPTPIRCFKAEEKVKGMEIGNELFETLGKSVLEEVNPRTSWRASKEFRLQLVEELGKRAVKQAVINAGGEWDA